MHPSSILCREQEAQQRARATSALLDNVRIVAEKAAVAWGREAVAAERREARHDRARTIAEIISLQKQQFRDEEERSFSENPDRGLADL